MTRRIGILGSPDSWYTSDLRRAASARAVDAVVVSFTDLAVELNAIDDVRVLSRVRARENSERTPIDLSALDAVLVRTMPVGSLEQVIFRMDALHVAHSSGLAVINPPRALEIAIDKWLTLHRLAQAGIDVPETICCQDRDSAMEAFDILEGDIVLKPLFGGEGRGIMRISDRDLAWRVLGTIQQIGQVMYVQKYLPHHGYDVRILIIGQNAIAVKRMARDGNWRTNLSQGGSAQPHSITHCELDLAHRASAAIGGDMLGIDLLPTQDGRTVILEVNAVPGWKGTAAALGLDVAGMAIDLLLSRSRC